MTEDQFWQDKNGLFHRDDGPAVIRANGAQKWFQHGKLHRTDGPAKTSPESNQGKYWGKKMWFIDGQLHRDNGPAVILGNGTKKWFRNNALHREDGPAIEHPNGDKEWWEKGRLHRVGAPAIDTEVLEAWMYEGKLHRDNDKPALYRKILKSQRNEYTYLYRYCGHFRQFLDYHLTADEGEQQWWEKGKLIKKASLPHEH